MLLDKINEPSDLKELNLQQLKVLASEVRSILINKASIVGGHLPSNLGVVELTIALHYVFSSPRDHIIFDVSHQSYCHKILTGRKVAFTNPEEFDSVGGFTDPDESEHDVFNVGHTSTSISLACGMAKARDLKSTGEFVIAVIGDGALGGGEALVGLNFASELRSNLIIIVNDNQMSIAENHGGLYPHLKILRDTNGKSANNIFKALGLSYIYEAEGHNIEKLILMLNKAREINGPIVCHICTEKGHGYDIAIKNKERLHWASPFDIATGKPKRERNNNNYGYIVSEYLLQKLKSDQSVAVVTAAMPVNIGFDKIKREIAGKQYVDVGIQEQHAISMVAGMAKNGLKPVFATSATFYQRAIDQIEQELCISKCPATMIVTHASVYGYNSITHCGLADIQLLSNIQNLVYLAPTNKQEYMAMLDWSIEQTLYPVAIRVPWNGVYEADRIVTKDFSDLNKYELVQQGSDIAIIAVGDFFQLGEAVAEDLFNKYQIKPTIINPRYLSGLDEKMLRNLQEKHVLIVTIEDGFVSGGYGSKIAQFYSLSKIRVINCGFTKPIPTRYNPAELIEANGLTKEAIVRQVMKELRV